MTEDNAPPRPWRLSHNDRVLLRKLRIAEDEPEPDEATGVCGECGGSGRVIDKLTAWAVCPVCVGTGYLAEL